MQSVSSSFLIGSVGTHKMQDFLFSDLVTAYKKCRQGKKPSNAQIRFESRLGNELLTLFEEIKRKSYQPKPYHCFSVTHPKPREIFAAHFRDRLIHHCILEKLEHSWEKRFFAYSFACRKNLGPLKAVSHLQKKAQILLRSHEKRLFVLQLDIASFFVSIHRPTLKTLLLQGLNPHSELAYLIRAVFDPVPQKNVSSTFGLKRELIPFEKSLFNRPDEFGLPIGNLTSQFGANVYLNALDHFIARRLRPEGYLRYMDDLTLLGTSCENLSKMINPIDDFLFKTRFLRLNPKKTTLTSPREKPIFYLGFSLRETHNQLQITLPAKKKWNFIRALRAQENWTFPQFHVPHPLSFSLQRKDYQKVHSKVAAHLGYLKKASTYRFRKQASLYALPEVKLLLAD